MSVYKKQALVEAPLEVVWELVGNPSRHPEWWPRVVDVKGQRFLEGDQYAQVTKEYAGKVKTNFLVERRDDLRELKLRCQTTGTYAHWLLAETQAGTFVDVEFGMDPLRTVDRVFDRSVGRVFFRRWIDQSVEGLKDAASRSAASEAAETARL